MNNHIRLSTVLVLFASLPCAAATAPGLWLTPHKDSCNTARADVAGNMKTAPHVIWSYGTPADTATYIKPVRLDGRECYFTQIRRGLRLRDPDGATIWSRPTMGVSTVVAVLEFAGEGRPVAIVMLGNEQFEVLDVATGKTLWTWSVPTGAYLGGYRLLDEGRTAKLIVFPQNSMLGHCFEIAASRPVPKLVWQKDYTGRYWQNFGPFFVLADMDNDDGPEIALAGKPGYIGVIDIDTGDVKFNLKYPVSGAEDVGRPYGLICATDIDGDGYRDAVVVGCQVEQYISVLKNNAGKSFSLAWSQFAGLDMPVGETELRPNVTSLADVNGDGSKELVIGFYNGDGDKRWHTIVFDTMKGFRVRLADLPDRYFWGCYDLDGDSRPEIITSTIKERNWTMPANVQAVDGRTFRDVATVPQAAFVFMHTRPPHDTGFHALRNTPAHITTGGKSGGLLLTRDGSEVIWRVKDGESVFEPFSLSGTSRGVLFSEATGNISKLNTTMKELPVRQGLAVSSPLVSLSNGRRELVLARSDGTIIGGVPDFSRPGVFESSWTVPGVTPAIWMGPNGRHILCVADPTKDAVALYEPTPGCEPRLVTRVSTPQPLSRSGTGLLPYGGDMRLLVGMHTGAHPTSSIVFDRRGRIVWSDPENGPHPRDAAAGDLDGNGSDEVFIDNHGKHMIYDPSGKGRMVAQGWHDTIPGRHDGAKYALPIIGPFGPKGQTRIVLSCGLDASEVLDGSGARLAKSNYANTYDFDRCLAAIARIRRDGWDIGMIDKAGVFQCADTETCRVRWTLDLGCRATSMIEVSSADVDSDGRDNFLVGLPNGELLALDETNGRGCVLWKLRLDAGVNKAFTADLDADGRGEIVVELDDGRVAVLR